MANSIRKSISNKTTNASPSMIATGKFKYKFEKVIEFININYFLELMNNAKILSTTNKFANQVQPISARFAPNLETIQNALKYDKKLRYPSVLEFEKVRNLSHLFYFSYIILIHFINRFVP